MLLFPTNCKICSWFSRVKGSGAAPFCRFSRVPGVSGNPAGSRFDLSMGHRQRGVGSEATSEYHRGEDISPGEQKPACSSRNHLTRPALASSIPCGGWHDETVTDHLQVMKWESMQDFHIGKQFHDQSGGDARPGFGECVPLS